MQTPIPHLNPLSQNGKADALEQNGEPVAYITETEKGDMVWTPDMYSEACTYCDDGEFPVPLYKSAEPIKQPQVTFWSPSSSAKQATHYPNTKE